MEPESRKASAPYGHACSGCAKAKCRCIGRGLGLSCERCARLQRECQPSTVTRKRQAQAGTRNRTKQLEDKLNDIMTMLRSEAGTASSIRSKTREETLLTNQHELPTRSNPGQSIEVASSRSGLSYQSPASTADPSIHHAEEYLNRFRSLHLKFFPFIHIPDDMSALQLRHDRPFLWLNIYCVTCKSMTEQRKSEAKIREVISKKLIVDMERSMDLLLGLIVYLGWYVSLDKNKKMLCIMMGLATSLVIDLCLDRRTQQSLCKETNTFNAFHGYWWTGDVTMQRSNEDRRAVLGCYVSCTSIASFLRSPPMRWTPHMEECLNHLERMPEVEGDEILVVMVKLSRLAEEIYVATCWRLNDPEIPNYPKTPPYMLVKTLETRLKEIRDRVPITLLENKSLLSQLNFVDMILHELPLYPLTENNQPSGQALSARIACAESCFVALRACLDGFYVLTPEESWAAPMCMQLHFARSTHILFRLTISADPAWDRRILRDTLDVTKALEKGASTYGSVPEAVGIETDGDDIYKRSAETMRYAIPIWTKVISEAQGDSQVLPTEEPNGTLADQGMVDFGLTDFPDNWLSGASMGDFI